jgi:4a-hydroxytetrahydrobiopterin dehydratase
MGDEEWASRFAEAGVTGWHIRESTARTSITCGSFRAAGELAAQVARVCDDVNHHPEIDVRSPDIVRVTTWSHDVGGLSERDIALALAVSALFEERRRPVD